MADLRHVRLAKILVEHSTKVKKGDVVRISADIVAEPLVNEIYKLCLTKGAHVYVRMAPERLSYFFFRYAKTFQIQKFPEIAMYEAKKTDVFINIHGASNTRMFSNIDSKVMAARSKVVDSISKVVLKKRWVGLDYPTNGLAQEADMSLEEYERFLFEATNVDYDKMSKQQEKLKKIVDRGKNVRIIGDNTDLRMSINKMLAKKCYGLCNVPGGEVFTAPEKYSAEGHIQFSYPAIRAGKEVDGVYLEFKKGKVVKARATKNEKFLKTMLAMDKGSSYLGELGIGTNFNIKKYTKNLLFDEKIGGTIHLALGMGYAECGVNNKKNLNNSALHWDIVRDLRKQGKLIIDGKVVIEKGKFKI